MGILRVNQVSGDETQLSTLGIGTTTPVTGSVFFDGNGDYLEVPPTNNSDWAFDGAFTIEHWTYWNVVADGQLLSPGTGGIANAWYWQYYSNQLQIGRQAVASDLTANFTPSPNKWYHIAISRDSLNLTKIFVDGNQIGSGTVTSKYAIPSSNLLIGYGGAGYFNGYLSNVRVLKGTALYTANFTPPTLILEPIQDTVLLCCNNPNSAAAVSLAGIGTSKTITVNGDAVASTFNPGLVRNFTSGTQFSGVAKIDTQGYFVPPSGTTTQRGRGRGVFGGGENVTNTIDYIQIQSQGIAQDFGDLTQQKRFAVACSSSTRGVFGGGGTGPGNTLSNVLEFITISTTGNSITFGSLIAPTHRSSSCSSSTRGLFAGGYSPATPTLSNAIDYITIASIGNSQDFGDLSIARFGPGALASSIRGVFFGGQTTTPPTSPAVFTNVIEYVTIASTGNTVTFGNIASSGLRESCGCASPTRGVYGSGYSPASPGTSLTNVMEYITISSTGNGTDFGDLTQARTEVYGSTSNSIRGVWAGGQSPSLVNTIDYVIISSTGNAQDFGDLTGVRSGVGACSDSHGGIS